MSDPRFPVNRSNQQQEMEKAAKDIEKNFKPQEHTGNSPMQMNSEEYAEFLEIQKSEREARIKIERKRRRAANIHIYTALVLGIIGFAAGFYEYNMGVGLFVGWFAVICSALGMISLIRHSFGPYGTGIGLLGIIGFGLCSFGIIGGLLTIGTAIVRP